MDGGLSVQGDGMMDRNHNLFLGIEPNNPVESRIVIRSYNVFSPHDILHCKRLLLSVTSFCREPLSCLEAFLPCDLTVLLCHSDTVTAVTTPTPSVR